MKEIAASAITENVARLFIKANTILGEDIVSALKSCMKSESSPTGRDTLYQLTKNAETARATSIPLCQDTGLALVFLEIGQDVHIFGGDLVAAVNEGVRRGCRIGYLRPSVVSPPSGARVNTGDNTPAIVHTFIVPGDALRIIVAPQGAGGENVSALKMLRPADGQEGVKRFVVSTVEEFGSEACPPLVVGVGIGGSFEQCALLSKRALLRPLGRIHPDAAVAALEDELLEAINRLGLGPAGLGGKVTALAVHVETSPCHVASLPVAVSLGCHAYRHGEVTL